MPADLAATARTFVAALVSNAAARDAFTAAMHPVDPARAAAVISQYGAPVDAADIPAIVPLIGELLGKARAGGASAPSGNIMPNDDATAGDATGSIMSGDSGGPSGNIMSPDDGGSTGNIMSPDAGGASGNIMPGDKEH